MAIWGELANSGVEGGQRLTQFRNKEPIKHFEWGSNVIGCFYHSSFIMC